MREFPEIGFPYKASNHSFTETVYIKNQPGANFIGSNYASAEDGVYVVYKHKCHRLDPETGETLAVFSLLRPGDYTLVFQPFPTMTLVGGNTQAIPVTAAATAARTAPAASAGPTRC